MKVIYHCYGGTHTSIIAASIHVGRLSWERFPCDNDILNLKLFDSLKSQDQGKIFYFGRDENGVEVYSCGMKNKATIVKNAIEDILVIYGINSKELYFASTLPYINLYIRIGGFLSRSLGLVGLGRMILLKGSKNNYNDIVSFVKQVKFELKFNMDKKR